MQFAMIHLDLAFKFIYLSLELLVKGHHLYNGTWIKQFGLPYFRFSWKFREWRLSHTNKGTIPGEEDHSFYPYEYQMSVDKMYVMMKR
jgi:alpha-N-acetylglucosamine transferase